MLRAFFLLLSWIALSAGSLAKAEDAPPGKDATIEQFLQSLSTVDKVMERKDPFAELPPPFETAAVTNERGESDPGAPNMSAPLLERYTIAEYEVVAVLLGDQYPRALLRLPAEGTGRKVVIVKEADKLGNRKGVISKITLEGIYVQQAQRSAHGFVDKTEVLLKVGGRTEDQKRAMVARQVDAKDEK